MSNQLVEVTLFDHQTGTTRLFMVSALDMGQSLMDELAGMILTCDGNVWTNYVDSVVERKK